MKKILFIALFGISLLQSYSQTLEYSWARKAGGNYTDKGNAIATDVDGNVVVAGTFFSDSIKLGDITLKKSDSTSACMFVAKYNPAGNIIWAKRASTTSSYKTTYGYSVATDKNGNIFVCGDLWGDSVSFDGNLTILPKETQNASFVVKYSSAGNYQWVKMAIGGRATSSITIDGNEDLYMTGIFNNVVNFDGLEYTVGAGGHFIAKYNNSGGFIWANVTSVSVSSYGFNSEWDTKSVYTDSDHNVYLTGWSGTDTTFFNASRTIYVTNNASLRNVFLVKYNSNGVPLWAKGAQVTVTPGTSTITANNIRVSDQSVYLTGWWTGDSLRFDNNQITSNSYQNMFIAKFDDSGNNIWVKSLGSQGNDYGNGLAFDSSGDLYLIGTTEGSDIHFNNILVGTTTGGNLATIFKIDADGNFLELKHPDNIPYYGACFGNDIAIDHSDNIYITGGFSSGVAFGNDILSGTNLWQDMFISKLIKSINDGINTPATSQHNLRIYPNPSSDFIFIDLPGENADEVTEICVYDITGKLLKNEKIKGYPVKVELAGLVDGEYLITAITNNSIKRQKIIIQR